MPVFYDDCGTIGRRYRRHDEERTPYCITVDFDTLGENEEDLKNTVTIRHRDSLDHGTHQDRCAVGMVAEAGKMISSAFAREKIHEVESTIGFTTHRNFRNVPELFGGCCRNRRFPTC